MNTLDTFLLVGYLITLAACSKRLAAFLCLFAAGFCFLFGSIDGKDQYLYLVFFGVYALTSYAMAKHFSARVAIATWLTAVYDLAYAFDSMLYGNEGLIETRETWIWSNHEITVVTLHIIIMCVLIQKCNSLVGSACYNVRMLFTAVLHRLAFCSGIKRKGG